MMSEVPVNSDDEYVDESFEEDSQSEVEEEQEISEDDYDDANQMQLEQLEEEQEDEEEESDSQSESDVEAEFMRGNPHARRQQLYSGRSTGGFNHTRMPTYPSSSSDDESNVVVTKTVAEVNELVGVLRIHEEDEALSVRTLKPGSAHNKTVREEQREPDVTEVEEIEEEEEEDEEEVIQYHAVNNNYIDDDAESVDEEEEEEELQIEENEDDQKTEVDHHEYNDMGDEDQEQYLDDDNGGGEEEEVIQMNMEDTVTVVDASDNSSDQSGPVSRMHNADNLSLYSAETEFTVVQERTPRKPSGIPMPVSLNSSRSARQRGEANVEPPPMENVQPPETYQQTDLEFIGYEKEVVETTPPPQLEDFVNDSSMKPDAAAVKYLEQKMTQMSEMIMNSFRMSGGAVNNPALEQLAMATGMMQSHAARLGTVEECDSISTTGSSAQISSRSCGDRRRPTPQHHHLDSQNTVGTVRSARLARPSCRCPSAMDSLAGVAELQPEMELDMDEFLMDECGQGDGLMRHHPHRRRQQQNVNCGFSSATPSTTYSSGAGKCAPGALRPRSSTDKVNNKNAGRKSFSFSNYQVREIERQNHILLKKMMSVKPTATIKASTSSIKCNPNAPPKQTPPVARLSSAAVNRKKGQRQIDLDNDLLKRKLEAIGARRPQFK
ncbi:uncharacterized protein Dwil_GK11597 [Drosophila willistoni]|uniref:Protein hemingway n=1 Tax=Drosophila willistoni TaxID=7260 RepID=B4N9D2_DROWI|nr:protein hemingway [Drosophila willistoni]EDW80565.2 uncharacterized protein Dwil_GK11597 [Drosophila willistoni]